MDEAGYKLLTPLVDGDILLYRCGFAADSQIKKEYLEKFPGASPDEIKEFKDSLEYQAFALGNTKTIMDSLAKMFNAETMETYVTGSGNFREQAATLLPYKGNRDPLAKPKYYREIKQYLIDSWDAQLVNGREADDALGCRQWAAKDRSTIICSIDKDLDMIPGHHFNFVKGEYYYVTKYWADTRLFHQMLVGDRTDNIPGINKIGEVRAKALYDSVGGDRDRLRQIVRDKYEEQYGPDWERAYNECALLLWMQREEGQECPFL